MDSMAGNLRNIQHLLHTLIGQEAYGHHGYHFNVANRQSHIESLESLGLVYFFDSVFETDKSAGL